MPQSTFNPLQSLSHVLHCSHYTILTRVRFARLEAFAEFCKLGGIEPHSYAVWKTHRDWLQFYVTYIWASKDRDVILETRENPIDTGGYCFDLGVIGVESKVTRMFDFFREGMQEPACPRHPSNVTEWSEMAWAREWI